MSMFCFDQVFIYDPKDRKNMDKIWRACSNHDKAESFRKMGDANRSIRATGMNPESSRGHTLFILRFRKEVHLGHNPEKRSKFLGIVNVVLVQFFFFFGGGGTLRT